MPTLVIAVIISVISFQVGLTTGKQPIVKAFEAAKAMEEMYRTMGEAKYNALRNVYDRHMERYHAEE